MEENYFTTDFTDYTDFEKLVWGLGNGVREGVESRSRETESISLICELFCG